MAVARPSCEFETDERIDDFARVDDGRDVVVLKITWMPVVS